MSLTKEEIFKDVMSHFDYHWFWGLNYHEIAPINNLAVEIDALIRDEELQGSFRDKLIPILIFEHPIVIFIYWLFNIDNFRVNLYKWAACIAHNEFVLAKEDRPLHIDLERRGWDLGAINWFRIELNKRAPEEQNNIFTNRTEQDASNPQFTVNRTMQPYLQTLEIHRGSGESISWEEIRKAFKKKALRVHPDKNSNMEEANEAFNKLKEALDYFESLTQGNDDSIFNIEQRLDNLRIGINKLNKRREEFDIALQELNQRIDRLILIRKAEREKQTMSIDTDTVIHINNLDREVSKRPSSDSSNEMSSLLVSNGLYTIKTSDEVPLAGEFQESRGFELI